jgi:hypothetical protein
MRGVRGEKGRTLSCNDELASSSVCHRQETDMEGDWGTRLGHKMRGKMRGKINKPESDQHRLSCEEWD